MALPFYMLVKTSKVIFRFLGLPLSSLYALLAFLRNKAYDLGHKSKISVKPTVLSIGNIVAGGTGKTPWTLKIAQDLLNFDPSLTILSRGYRSKFEHLKHSTLICKGEGPLFSPDLCGDEPYMICQNLPHISFYVGKHRIQSALLAQERGASILLLDDGMQHRKLARDFECIILDRRDLFGRGYFLPSGKLRDSPKSLSRAHLVIVNHTTEHDAFDSIEKKIRSYTNAPLVFTQFKVNGFFDLEHHPKTLQKGLNCAAFCGLGQPDGFYELLEKQGLFLTSKKNLKDHEPFEISELPQWVSRAKKKGAQAIICTEKDAVKLPRNLELDLPLYQLKIKPHIVKGAKNYENFLKNIRMFTQIIQSN